jgi:ethanolaminephosphotransferase
LSNYSTTVSINRFPAASATAAGAAAVFFMHPMCPQGVKNGEKNTSSHDADSKKNQVTSTTTTTKNMSTTVGGFYYYLTPDARDKLPQYQYQGSDLSFLYQYVLSPLAECLVQTIVPTSMAPNTITLLGLLWMMSSYALYWWYVPNLLLLVVVEEEETTETTTMDIPRWIFLYNALAMLGYQTLDNMDGKQARRTQSSSPLGLLFDHGCDAINSIFGSANWIIGMALVVGVVPSSSSVNNTTSLWQVWALVFGPFAMFYVATWEQYYTGKLILPIINGPNEGLLGGILLSLTSFLYGSHYWQQYDWQDTLEASLGMSVSSIIGDVKLRNCDFVIIASSIGFVQEIVWKSVSVTREYKASALQAMLPFGILAGCFWFLGVFQPQLLLQNPRTSLHLAMILFVEMSTELMLAHVTAQPFYPWRRWQLLPLILLTLWAAAPSTTADTNMLQYALTAYTWSIGTYLIMKCVLVIHEICNVLQIWCFDIVTPYPTNQGRISRGRPIMTSRTTSSSSIPKRPPKTIYLIRHAESRENERMAALSRVLKALAKLQFPSLSDIWASIELLNVPGQVDSPVSSTVGAQQIACMRKILDKNHFVPTAGIQLVAHSPLIRACQTCEGMLGCVGTSSSQSFAANAAANVTTSPVSRVLKTGLLLEKSPLEWTPLCYNGFLDRIGEFEAWLWDQEKEVVALVGHSQFFKAMLGLDFKFGNCDVWKVQFDLSALDDPPKQNAKSANSKWVLPPQWSELELLYECHPTDL